MRRGELGFLLAALLSAGSAHLLPLRVPRRREDEGGEPPPPSSHLPVFISLNEGDLGEGVGRRIRDHLRPWLGHDEREERIIVESLLDQFSSGVVYPAGWVHHQGAILLSFGETAVWKALASEQDRDSWDYAAPESISLLLQWRNGVVVAACNGSPMSEGVQFLESDTSPHGHYRSGEIRISSGAVTAAYALLEELGFSFLHPLEPMAPRELSLPLPFVRHESPRWTHRGFHLHTMHPLELTDVLQGFEVSASDSSACKRCSAESWESMLEEVELFFEWCAANRVNRVQWILLGNRRWGENNYSTQRLERLRRIVRLAHQFGILAGIDVPLGLLQQHAWVMVSPFSNREKRHSLIKERCDWLAAAGFDFISTESGLTEFNNPGDEAMLDLLNAFSNYVNGTLLLPAYVKVHVSQGQTCSHFMDPRNISEPLNFNFLPTYASPTLGILAHTVQAYGLDDPTWGVYGNSNFTEMGEYMFYEAARGVREVLYYGETSYWVSVDIDVPLFMPLYGERRLHDLRLIAGREERDGFRIAGQMNFDSGWEWGYWLSNVLTARSAWDPLRNAESDELAVKHILAPLFRPIYGVEMGDRLVSWIVWLCKSQHSLLLLGREPEGEEEGRESRKSSDTVLHVSHNRLTGMGYMSGTDTWFELPRYASRNHMTQPDKVQPHEFSDPQYPLVLPLLSAMEHEFSRLRDELDILRAVAEETHLSLDVLGFRLLDEMRDGIDMLVMRASHVKTVYLARAPGTPPAKTQEYLLRGRDILEQASNVVRKREAAYRASLWRIAHWRETGPTVYRYGYLWAVHSLFFWWRDQGKAEMMHSPGPCFLNRIDALETAVGIGRHTMQILRLALAWVIPFYRDLFVNCLAPPEGGYEFPRDLFPEAV